MVLNKQAKALLLTGRGGIGKTATVMNAVATSGKEVKVIKGSATPKAFYRILLENPNKTIIFDDCDEILTNKKCFDLIKAAVDSYNDRTISWEVDRKAGGMPTSFTFTGTLIFISNLDIAEVDQAIRTRCINVDLTMTVGEKVERMRQILSSPKFLPNVSYNDKFECLALIAENMSTLNNLSIRSLIQACEIKAVTQYNWKEIALYALRAGA